MTLPVVYIVVPCYNEQEVLPETSKRLEEKAEQLVHDDRCSECRIMFVNDGSKDNTWEQIEEYHNRNPKIFTGLSLSRNRGHQNALLAGITQAAELADVIISMDADLQDDINAVDEMLDKYNNENCEVVYGVRRKRKTDTVFKRVTARGFYKFMSVMGADVVYDHADYRLLSRRAAKALLEFNEVNLFLRGIVTLVGFKSDKVYYDRGERFAGESKYPLKKMLAFAIDGITSFSVKPLKMITGTGFLMAIVALVFLVKAIVDHYTGNANAGWPSIMCSIWFIGGVQTMCIGIIGEYIGKIYGETKHRPRFIIDKFLG